MKKILFTITLFVTLTIGTAQAQSLIVHYVSGLIETFELSDMSQISFSEISDEFEGFLVINHTDDSRYQIPMEEIDFVSFYGKQNYPSGAGVNYLYEVDSWLAAGTVNEEIDKSLVAGNWWYEFSEDGIEINGVIDYTVMGGYYGCLGFYLDPDTVNKYFGLGETEYVDIATTTLAIFYPLDGNLEEIAGGWSTYEPGEWYDATGNPSTYTAGAAYWYYQIYESQADSYDFRNEIGYKRGYVLLGQRPNNPKIMEDSVYTHHSVLNGKKWTVNISYRNVPEQDDPNEDTKAYKGSGTTSTGHQYKWDINEDAIKIEVTINKDTLTGSWEMGYFYMGTEAISELIGQDITTMGNDVTQFFPVEPDGTEGTSWTSYIPGQWVDLTGAASDWSSGVLYWQYQCVENYDGHANIGEFVVGTNPTNVESVVDGTTVVSKAKLCGIDFIVTVNFRTAASMVSVASESGNCLYWELDQWLNNGVADESIDKTLESGTWSYDITQSGITINGRINAQVCGEYEPCIGFYLSPDTLAKYLGLDPNETDISSFYPVNSSGEPLTDWTAYAPGQWYDKDGEPTAWGKGPAFWYYQIYSGSYYDLTEDGTDFKYGYFVMGQAPNSEDINEKTTYTSKSVFNGKTWTVNITFFNTVIEYDDPDTPTGEGTVGAHSYSWDISDSGININCTVNCDSVGSAWEIFSFLLGRNQISELIGENIGEIGDDITKFYPIEPDETADSVWTSYVPGQWVDLGGTAGSWSSGVLYWQYQCVKNYDSHETLGEFVVGTNPSNVATAKGQTVVSRAKLLGFDFTVTVKFE